MLAQERPISWRSLNNTIMRTFASSIALLISFTATAQWSQVNTGISDLSQGAAVLGGTLSHLFAKAGTSMYRSTNNGDSWSEIQPPIALNPTECGFLSNGRYIAGMNAATACIYYTDDNGDSWTEATGAPTATVVRGFYEYGGGIFAYTSNAGIYVSLDGGTSWAASNTGLTNLNVVGMAAYGPYLLACTIGGGVFRSPGGSSWTASAGIAGGDLNGENIWNMGSSLYYTAQGGARYRSTDLGSSWSAWTGPAQFGLGLLEVKRYVSRLYIETRHFSGGLRDSLYVSWNDGSSWINITGNLNATDLNGSGIFEYNGYAFIGYNSISPGLGIYRYALSTDMGEALAASIPTVFPNPADDRVSITWPHDLGAVDYVLLDAAGRGVMSGRMMPGTAQVELAMLAPGCYLLRWDDAALAPVRVVKR